MASASVTLPDSLDSTFELRYRHGVISQSLDSLTSNPTSDLLKYFIGQDWRNRAACIDAPPEIFFPERGVPGEGIRDICFSCPVRVECLDYSIASMPKYGWFGGHPEEGRKKIRRLLRKGVSLDEADALVLADALAKVRQRKKKERGKKFDTALGDVVIGEFDLAAVS